MRTAPPPGDGLMAAIPRAQGSPIRGGGIIWVRLISYPHFLQLPRHRPLSRIPGVEASCCPYGSCGRAIVMFGDVHFSTCAGLRGSPSAFSTVSSRRYVPFGTSLRRPFWRLAVVPSHAKRNSDVAVLLRGRKFSSSASRSDSPVAASKTSSFRFRPLTRPMHHSPPPSPVRSSTLRNYRISTSLPPMPAMSGCC